MKMKRFTIPPEIRIFFLCTLVCCPAGLIRAEEPSRNSERAVNIRGGRSEHQEDTRQNENPGYPAVFGGPDELRVRDMECVLTVWREENQVDIDDVLGFLYEKLPKDLYLVYHPGAGGGGMVKFGVLVRY